MKIEAVQFQQWQGKDGLDTYDIFKFKGIYVVFKNERIWIASCKTLADACRECEQETELVHWHSLNPENAARYAANRAERDKNRKELDRQRQQIPERRKRPKLYKGRKRHNEPEPYDTHDTHDGHDDV
jgi:hypothetical protein